MRLRNLSALALLCAFGLAACDDNKATKSVGDAPESSARVGSVPPPPEPSTYTPAPAPAPAPTLTISEPVPAPAPAPKPTKTVKVVGPAGVGGTYTVKKGESLTVISQKIYGTKNRYKEIAALNGIKDPNKIKAGQVLKLP